MLADAIDHYHSLLTEELAAETQAQLDDQLRRRGLFFGDRALCTVMRPRFLTRDQHRHLQSRCALLLSAFAKAHAAAVSDASVRGQFGLLDWEERLVAFDPGFEPASPTSRIDAFYFPDSGAMSLTEYNAETPAGAAYNDSLAEIFCDLPVMREFLKRYAVLPLPARHGVFHALIEAYYQWAGRREAPRIGILDWPEVPTFSEFVLYRDYFRALGLECVIADPREVEFRDASLWAGGERITLIYKRVLLSELVGEGGLDHPVIQAVRARAACMVNPFRCKILHKKASLAVLSDERNAGWFSTAERGAIGAHVPWTRRVEERRTTHGKREIDLLPFVLENRERLVLKPNDDYGGRGIVLGWEASDSSWAQALKVALDEPYIVQERVAIPSEAYPSFVDGRVVCYERMIDTAPFGVHGAYVDAMLTRLSTAALLNVTAGGGSTVPAFLVERR